MDEPVAIPRRRMSSEMTDTGVGQGRAETKLLICIVVVAATLVAYEPVRHNEFVNYDDPAFITSNSHVRDGLSWEGVKWAFGGAHVDYWRPLTWLSHMADCQLYGLNAAGHHAMSVIIHIVTSLLLFYLFQRMTGAMWRSGFVAAAFALHPVHVEAVAWAAERKDVLGGLFWVLTMLAYMQYVDRPGIRRYLSVVALFAMAIMSKPMVVTLPFVLLLLDYWPLERFRWRRSSNRADHQTIWAGRLVLEKMPLLLMSAGLAVMTVVAQADIGAVSAVELVPVSYRIGNMFVSYVAYIGQTIWPIGLAVIYPLNPMDRAAVAPAPLFAVMLAAATIGALYIGRRRRYVAVGWLWYIGTLVPVIGLVQVGPQAMADRYMYIPMVGLLIIASWGVGDLASGRRWKQAVVAVMGTAAVFAMVVLARIQVTYWRNSVTLFEHALKAVGSNPLAEDSYGNALFKAGRADEAVVHLSRAVEMSPTFFDARNNLGKVFLQQGKADEAIACFEELIERGHDPADVYYDLGVALGMQGRYDQAVRCFDNVLEREPDYPSARKRIGSALLGAGKPAEAVSYLERALEATGDDAEVYMNLGVAHARCGRPEPAKENWARAIHIEPNNANILNNIAWMLATSGEVAGDEAAKAVELAQRACELTAFKDAGYLDTLAAAHASAGRFPEAIETARKALNMAEAAGQQGYIGGIRGRLKLYQEGRAYRED